LSSNARAINGKPVNYLSVIFEHFYDIRDHHVSISAADAFHCRSGLNIAPGLR